MSCGAQLGTTWMKWAAPSGPHVYTHVGPTWAPWAKPHSAYVDNPHGAYVPAYTGPTWAWDGLADWGNTFADTAAKKALNEPVSNIFILYSDLRPCVNIYIKKLWQEFWDSSPDNKLFQIQPKLESPIPMYYGNRKKETVFSRLHIGHTYFSHSYLLKGEDPPHCIACDEPYTVKHVLISCVDLLEIRQKYYSVNSLFRLFREVSPDIIFAFLEEISLFRKI